MGTVRVVLFVIFVVDSFFLVIVVLLQSGRGGGLAGALGGIGGADSALGVRAASQIEKATGIMAVIFFATALALAFMAGAAVPEPKAPKIGGEGVGGIGTTPPADTSPAAGTTLPAVTTGAASSTRSEGITATSPGTAEK